MPAQPILSVDEFPITDGSTACIPLIVFYDGKGDEDALDSGRSRHFHSGRHRSQHSDCRFSDIKAYDGAVKILLALTVAGQVRLLYNQWGNFVFRR